MPALADVQTRIRDAILGADAAALRGIVADDRLGHAARLNVYRNNTTILLTEALAANFPIVQTLVGEDFFAHVARAFIRTRPPRTPCLFEYGADFAAFLETVPGAEPLVYLPDTARLEWAVNEALHAAHAPALDAQSLDRTQPEDYAALTFTAHPAARIVSSPYPIHAIWAIHQPDAKTDAGVDLDQGGEAVLITRPGADVRIERLGPGEDMFLTRLMAGDALGDAFAHVQGLEPGFDGAQALTTVLNSGALYAFARN